MVSERIKRLISYNKDDMSLESTICVLNTWEFQLPNCTTISKPISCSRQKLIYKRGEQRTEFMMSSPMHCGFSVIMYINWTVLISDLIANTVICILERNEWRFEEFYTTRFKIHGVYMFIESHYLKKTNQIIMEDRIRRWCDRSDSI